MVSARELASFVGEFISASAVFGNISRIMTRYCAISVAAVKDWDWKFSLEQCAVFGNISRIMTRYCTISVAAVKDWDWKFSLDQ